MTRRHRRPSRKTIWLVRLDTRPRDDGTTEYDIVATHEFHATWEHIQAREREIDRVLLTEPDYDRSHLRVADRVFDLLGKRDYRSIKELERQGCHLIVTLVMLREKRAVDMSEIYGSDEWIVYVWTQANGRRGAHLAPKGRGELSDLPDLDRINIWT